MVGLGSHLQEKQSSFSFVILLEATGVQWHQLFCLKRSSFKEHTQPVSKAHLQDHALGQRQRLNRCATQASHLLFVRELNSGTKKINSNLGETQEVGEGC